MGGGETRSAAEVAWTASAATEAVVLRLAASVEEIAAISDFRNAYRKPLFSLSRRIKLLAALFDELADSPGTMAEDALRSLLPLEGAIASAKVLLRLGSEGSKIFLVLEKDKVLQRFQEVSNQLEEALNGISFDKLEVSDEVREQVELLHTQFRRAKDRIDMPDTEFYNDLLSLYRGDIDTKVDTSLLGKLAEGLQLMTISDLTQESLALHEMVTVSGGDPGESIEKVSMLLKKIKDFVQTKYPDLGAPVYQKLLLPDGKLIIPVIPDEFRCPISLELMKDPVIVATGQTYERSCIEKLIASKHETCPKTQQKLSNTSLTPNYALRSLIAKWCEANGMEPPRRPSQPSKPTLACSSSEHANVNSLLCKLSSSNLDDQRAAAGELRLLAKRNVENRICIAEAGAIPLLINLLSSVDIRSQEHAVTALLNLSIYEDNKASIMKAEAIPGIIYVLRNGSTEARENSAATLFSLSVVDEHKVLIGASGAIPALVSLLSEGTQRGKKDAATALFNLCIYQGNKAKAVRAGLVQLLLRLLTDPASTMLDEAMAILAILSSHQEGKTSISDAKAVPLLVQMMGTGSPRNKENAAAILLNLCGGEQQLHLLTEAEECGIMGPLRELAVSGTDRAKRKAVQLLERMSRYLEQQSELLAQAESYQALINVNDEQNVADMHSPNRQSWHQASGDMIDL